MNDAIESAAMIATGGLLAREAERLHAPDASGHDASGACANCGTVLDGPFCRMCGQQAHVHRTAGALVHDILHGVFHFEGKFWTTLPKLAFRPGDLTRRYVHGERAKFVSPMAMFLFSVFLLFAVVANLPGWSVGGGDFLNGVGVQGGMEKARDGLNQARIKADANFARRTEQLTKLRTDPKADPAEVARAERRVASARKDRQQIRQAEAFMPDPATVTKTSSKPDNWFEQKVQHAKENPKLLLYKMKSSAYKFSWALIPLSLPFLWILFPLRRGVGLYDHAIFATYSLSFMSLLVVALGLLGLIGIPNPILVLAAIAIPPVHMYHQFKRAYLLTRFGALWRTFWMVNFIGIIVPLFALILLYLGVAD